MPPAKCRFDGGVTAERGSVLFVATSDKAKEGKVEKNRGLQGPVSGGNGGRVPKCLERKSLERGESETP